MVVAGGGAGANDEVAGGGGGAGGFREGETPAAPYTGSPLKAGRQQSFDVDEMMKMKTSDFMNEAER